MANDYHMDGADTEQFHLYRKCWWMVLLQMAPVTWTMMWGGGGTPGVA